ncbi:MAG: hypothetical protein IT372_10960 [Polyangiaceae bacterium]|nr:hypothetical protein [Polyangiaceae bacterium]
MRWTITEYKRALTGLWRSEAHARGCEREELGLKALVFATYLRKHCSPVDGDPELLALAEDAERIGWLCLEHREPRGQS